MNTDKHIIEKVKLEVDVPNEKEAHKIRNDISGFLHNEVFPLIENLLDGYEINEQILRFDRLDINFNIDDWENRHQIKQQLLNRIKRQIDEKLEKGGGIRKRAKSFGLPNAGPNKKLFDKKHSTADEIKSAEYEFYSLRKSRQDIFLHFLSNGFLPWYGDEVTVTDFFEIEEWKKCLSESAFLKQITNLLKASGKARERLIMQFPLENIIVLLQNIGVVQLKPNAVVIENLMNLTEEEKKFILKALLVASLTPNEKDTVISLFKEFSSVYLKLDKSRPEPIRNVYDQFHIYLKKCCTNESVKVCFSLNKLKLKELDIHNKNKRQNEVIENRKKEFYQLENDETSKDSITENFPIIRSSENLFSDKQKERAFFGDDTNEVYIRNAGLVLLHPYLKDFFSVIGCLNQQDKILPVKAALAAQTLHYCATGQEKFFEANMAFEKYLCGLSLNTPIPQKSLMSEDIKAEANKLLIAVIENWKALKSTSVNGLQEAFLQRNGKLIRKERGYKLFVEHKVLDILLEKLPWGISMVKLPWKDDLLIVEWKL